MKTTTFLMLLLGFLPFFLPAQDTAIKPNEKYNWTLGIGAFELINIGVRIPLRQKQLGFNAGFFGQNKNRYASVSTDIYFHFGKDIERSSLKPWYFKTGLNLFIGLNENGYAYLNLPARAGRAFHFTDQWSLGIDFGGSLTVLASGVFYEGATLLLPSAGLKLAYHIF